MKTLIGHSIDEVMSFSPSIRRKRVGLNSSDDLDKNESSFIKLEIQAGALYRLIVESSVFIEEFYCADTRAKSLVNQALLDSLAKAEG